MSTSSSTPTQPIITIDDEQSGQSSQNEPVNESRLVNELFHPLIGDVRRCKQCADAIEETKGNRSGLINHYLGKHAAIWQEYIAIVAYFENVPNRRQACSSLQVVYFEAGILKS